VAGPFRTSNSSGIARTRKGRCNAFHEHEVATGDLRRPYHRGQDTRGRPREAAQKAVHEADRAAAELWSIQMEAYGGPAQPSPTIEQCINGGYGWLQVKCHRCETEASIPLDAIRRPRDTPIWKLEAALKCRSCKKGRYAPPVHMIRLTTERQTLLYVWTHPDDDDRR
jgi:Fe-S-cluster-containing hydrogenase component 2